MNRIMNGYFVFEYIYVRAFQFRTIRIQKKEKVHNTFCIAPTMLKRTRHNALMSETRSALSLQSHMHTLVKIISNDMRNHLSEQKAIHRTSKKKKILFKLSKQMIIIMIHD